MSHSQGSYPVQFRPWQDALRALPGDAIHCIDANVEALYGASIPGEFRRVSIPAGESSKSIREFERVHRELARLGCNRSTPLVALGGGVVGDLIGFVAATWMRGVPLIQVPTTLLAMVDSSVGGKVAIDLAEGKNLVGAFYPPQAVEVDPHFLKTLPDQHIANGMAEVIKYKYIASLDLPQPGEVEWSALIRNSIEIKRKIVEEDEFETSGLRATLNFGHTLGHAIESLTGYGPVLHGEAVGIGMVLEAEIAERYFGAKAGLADEVREDLQQFGLPIALQETFGTEAWLGAIRQDKKNTQSEIRMSLVLEPGVCKLLPVDSNAILEVLKQL